MSEFYVSNNCDERKQNQKVFLAEMKNLNEKKTLIAFNYEKKFTSLTKKL